MATVFDKILDTTTGRNSYDWYRKKVRSMTKPSARTLISQGKATIRPKYGVMNLFGYDPKHKAKLPYYDIFPLVLPLEPIKGGFMGMNFHYLPPLLRFKLLEKMQATASDKRFNKNTRFEVAYDDVKGIRLVKPTIKKYLYSHVQTGFLRVNADEAAIAIMLPVQRFKKASVGQVYSDSRRFI